MSSPYLEVRSPRERSVLPGLAIMAGAGLVALFLLAGTLTADAGLPYPYMLPWILALAVVLSIPSLILWYQGKFRLDNPLIFGTLSYMAPAFIGGALALATGISQPYFLHYIQDAPVNLPYTMQIIMLGYTGLAVGYFLPIGKKLGEWTALYLPDGNYERSSFTTPALILLVLGFVNYFISLFLGLFGFQRAAEIGSYDGLIFLLTLFWVMGSFILWFIIFSAKKLDTGHLVILGLLIATAVGKALFQGTRGSLIQSFSFVALAYIMSGREFKAKQMAISGAVVVALLVIGMIYGTAFRNLKGSEEIVGVGDYTENVLSTVDSLGSSNKGETIYSGLYSLAERVDTVSSLAVVVSSYEELAPYEESYGLDDNITKDLTTFLIPRAIWPDKPVASESRKYSELYFNYAENSFAITPMGDLLRNFGLIGVPIGMMMLGLLLRFAYRALVEDQAASVWRTTLYFMLVTSVSYEGFFAVIIPYAFKIGFTTIVGLVFAVLVAKRLSGGRKEPLAA